MAGILSSLSSTAYSLQSQSLAVQQAGKNITNINNPDYSRQRVIMGTFASEQSGVGATSSSLIALGTEQIRDVFLDRQILGETSYLSSLEAQDFRLRQALANLGDSIDRSSDSQFIDDISRTGGGLRSAIDSVFDNFEALSARPNDPTTRQVVFQAAEAVVETFHRIDTRYALLEKELDSQIIEETSNLNNLFKELDTLNREIARLEVADPNSALDLRDLRQEKLEQISEYVLIDANEIIGSNGQVQVTLRDDSAAEVTLTGPGISPREITFDTASRTFRIVGSGETLDMQAGLLHAIQEVQSEFVVQIRGKIDDLANSFATEINELYYQAFVPAGADPAVPEISFFQQPTPPPSAGGTGTVTAANIELYSGPSDPSVTEFVPLTAATLRATVTGISGANELALSIADLSTQRQGSLGQISYSEFATRIVSELGQDILNIQNRMSVQEDVKELLETRRAEISGVSMDEEVSNMIQFQRAYQATSRYFNILSEMLDTMINTI